MWPIQPLPERPGDRKLYHITVREEFDPEGNPCFRLYNHEAAAGDRLYKGRGPSKKPIAWPFDEEPSWMIHDDLASAESARDRLQTYLDLIEKK